MNTPDPNSRQDLSINKDNRHQFYETSLANAEQDFRQAGAQERQRKLREKKLKQRLRIVVAVFLVVVALSLAVVLSR